MDRFSKIWCDPVKVLQVFISVAFAVGLAVYVWLQATSGFDSDIVTEKALAVSVNDSVECNAYIFRDETVIGKNNQGAIVTVVSEGDRVSKGQLLANIYPNSEDAFLQDEINRIDRKIDILEKSNVDPGFAVSDLSKIDEDIGYTFADIFADSASGSISDAIDRSAELLIYLNKRDIVVNSGLDYSDEAKALYSERSNIEAQINSNSSSVYATNSGYFYGEVDGYEEIFDPDIIESLTLDEFENLINTEPDDAIVSSGAVKVINDFVWYTVCEISSEKAAILTEGNDYKIVFPESGDEAITMKLASKVTETTSPTALAVFRANKMPASFNYKRAQKAEVVIDTIEGLSVPKKAVRDVDDESGVYVLIGDVVHYRSIDIIETLDNYYIVRQSSAGDVFAQQANDDTEDADKKQPSKPLSLYDNIVVSGKDLFDGKIVG